MPPQGPVVCACFGVRETAIRELIGQIPGCTVADIGNSLKAGTNCGSCLPEMRKMLGRVLQSA
jgi:assimilatory nitrate reductase catalytic subunit